jgi:hypothetical protein
MSIVRCHSTTSKATLGQWVGKKRTFHNKNKLREDRKDLRDEIRFFLWRSDTAVAQSSATTDDNKQEEDARGLVIILYACIIYIIIVQNYELPVTGAGDQSLHRNRHRSLHNTRMYSFIQSCHEPAWRGGSLTRQQNQH